MTRVPLDSPKGKELLSQLSETLREANEARKAGEWGRIALLIERLGRPNAQAWALDAARSYRKVVLGRKTHTMYRERLIRSYLQLKRFALEGR